MQSENIINELNKSLNRESDNDVFKDFSSRIQTYIEGQKWVKKPLVLSPSICSQYGWKCVKINLLECVTCGAKLSASDSKISNFESYKTCIEKTLSCLKESHGKHCPWPITPSPDSFVRMTLMPKEEALSQFLKRVQLSLAFKTSFPKIKESVMVEMGLDDPHILSLCKLTEIKDEDACQFGKSVVLLAAAGWIITEEEDSKKPFLKCNNCLRCVWCGSFSLLNSEDCQEGKNVSLKDNDADISKSVSENGVSEKNDNDTSERPPLKKKRISFVIKKGEPFDPLYEHRPWCLWIHNGLDSYSCESNTKETKQSTAETSNLPGWKIFMKSLIKNVSDNQTLKAIDSPSKEKIRNVRNLLEQWTNTV